MSDQFDAKNNSSFASMFEESLHECKSVEGTVVTGTIVGISHDKAIIDVGLKSEGRLFLSDIMKLKDSDSVNIGDTLDVYIEKSEDRNGDPILSIERAKKEHIWNQLLGYMNEGRTINGIIFGRTKGGFSVDLDGTIAFLPGSQVDLRAVKDITPLLGTVQQFKIINMDKVRNNIVVSRRAALEAIRAEIKQEVLSKLNAGDIIDGVVKNITDYGAFVDIGGIDGLLHITDISWKRISTPQEVLNVGDKVKVQVIKFNQASGRISLGMKQLTKSPFEEIDSKYKVGEVYQGKIVSIVEYGIFVALDDNLEGMVHMSEISWLKRGGGSIKTVNIGDVVSVCILEINKERNKIALSMKRCQPNPWQKFAEDNPVGTKIKCVTKNSTEFGVFVGVTEDLDGMIHMSDISWDKYVIDNLEERFKPGEEIEVVVLDVNPEKERISLGIKQLTEDPLKHALEEINKNEAVTCTITEVQFAGMVVSLNNGLIGFIRRTEISNDRTKQRTNTYKVGDQVEAIVLDIDEKLRRISLSIKALDSKNEKEALEKFGNASSGSASLGDVLSEAMKKS